VSPGTPGPWQELRREFSIDRYIIDSYCGECGLAASYQSRYHRNMIAELTTPSAALRGLRLFFLMPQPPLLYQEGSRSLRIFTIRQYPMLNRDRTFRG
jgi:hypothetical protein